MDTGQPSAAGAATTEDGGWKMEDGKKGVLRSHKNLCRDCVNFHYCSTDEDRRREPPQTISRIEPLNRKRNIQHSTPNIEGARAAAFVQGWKLNVEG
jgi:hypothetical protein